jgi:hypothetical protein
VTGIGGRAKRAVPPEGESAPMTISPTPDADAPPRPPLIAEMPSFTVWAPKLAGLSEEKISEEVRRFMEMQAEGTA